jgi:hypothetical protein
MTKEDQAEWGCGFSGHDGKSRHLWVIPGEGDVLPEPVRHTCPRWYWQQPLVQEVYSDLEDYKRGALGDVLSLPAPYLDLLRVAEGARGAMQKECERQILEKDG